MMKGKKAKGKWNFVVKKKLKLEDYKKCKVPSKNTYSKLFRKEMNWCW